MTTTDELSRELSTLSTASSSNHTSHGHSNGDDIDGTDSISGSDTTMSASSSRPTTAGGMSSVTGAGFSSRESTGIYSRASEEDDVDDGKASFTSRENSKISQREASVDAGISSRESTSIYSHISKDDVDGDESYQRENSKMSQREDTMNSDKRPSSSSRNGSLLYSRENSSRISHGYDDDFEDDNDSDASSHSESGKQGKYKKLVMILTRGCGWVQVPAGSLSFVEIGLVNCVKSTF